MFSSVKLLAQSPSKINYQAIARDVLGDPLINQSVTFRFTIHLDNSSGPAVFTETQNATTNGFGLVNMVIGNGAGATNLSDVPWGANDVFLEVEIDPAGGSSFKSVSTTELVSVPYALHASTVENDSVIDDDADPENEIQSISQVGATITLSNGGGSVTIDVDDADSDATNEIQTISKTGNTVSLSKNGGTFTDAVDDADADPNNEFQTITKSGNNIVLSDGGGAFLSMMRMQVQPMRYK